MHTPPAACRSAAPEMSTLPNMQTDGEPVHYAGAVNGTDGSLQINGVTCFTRWVASAGSAEAQVLLPRHLLVVGLAGQVDEMVETSWDGVNSKRQHVASTDYCVVVPAGRRYRSSHCGTSSQRYASFQFEESAFLNVLGGGAQHVELIPQHGQRLLQRGIVERFDAVCRRPDDFPRAYTEALAAMLVTEVYRTHGMRPLPPQPAASVGTARFKVLLDYIEDHLDGDIGLSELAALVGLSVTHFSHAFRAAYHVPPYRYILERRVERAKSLLRTTTDTIATIAASVGFPSQSRFSQMFLRLTGVTPSTYRATAMAPTRRIATVKGTDLATARLVHPGA